jgi:polyphosphate kinase
MSIPFINRELSWVEFNQRVLNEALRDDLPLLERVKFLAITASNLDEFFQVRIGGLMAMRRGRKRPRTLRTHPYPHSWPRCASASKMTSDQYALLNNILLPELEKAGIHPFKPQDLSVEQSAQVSATFEDLIYPLLTPLAVDPGDAPLVPALQIIVACRLEDPETKLTRHALIPMPGHHQPPRFDHLRWRPGTRSCLIEDLVATHAGRFFPGETVTATTSFRVTRNGDIAVQEEDAIDLAGEMEDVLTARRFADTVRLEIRSDAPRDLARMIQDVTSAGTQEIQRVDGPPGLGAFMELAFLPDFDHLRDVDWPGQNSPAIAPGASMFETIANGRSPVISSLMNRSNRCFGSSRKRRSIPMSSPSNRCSTAPPASRASSTP